MRVVWAVWALWALGAAGGEEGRGALYGAGARYRLDGGLAVGQGAQGGALRLTGTLAVTPLPDQDDMLLMEFVDVIVEQQWGNAEWKKVGSVGGQWGAALQEGAAVLWLEGGEEGALRDVRRALGALLLGAGGGLTAAGGPWGRCALQEWADGGARRLHWQCGDGVTRVWRYQHQGGTITDIVSEETVCTADGDGDGGGGGAADAEVSVRARSWLRLTLAPPAPPPTPTAATLPPSLTPHPALFESRPLPHEQMVPGAEALSLLRALAEGAAAGAGGGADHAAAALTLHRALTHYSAAQLTHLVESCSPELLEALCEALGRCGLPSCRAAAAPLLRLGSDPAPALARAFFSGLSTAYRPHEEVITWAWEAGAGGAADTIRAAAVLGAAGAGLRALAPGALQRGAQRVLRALARCPAGDAGAQCRELHVLALPVEGALDALLEHAAGRCGRAATAALGALHRHAALLTAGQAARLLRLALDAPALVGGPRPLEVRAAALLAAVRALVGAAHGGAALLLMAARALGAHTAPHAGELRRLYWAALHDHPDITRQFPAAVRAHQLYALNGTSGVFSRALWAAGAYSARVSAHTTAAAGLLRHHSVSVADHGGELLRVDISVQGLHHLAGGEGDHDEPVRGALALSVRGAPHPPLTLFEGQGALLGALWAGTGSDTTPVLRAHLVQRVLRRRVPLLWGAVTLAGHSGAALALDARGSASLWARTGRARMALRAARHHAYNATAATAWGALSAGRSLHAGDALLVAADLDFYALPVLCVRAHTAPSSHQRAHWLVSGGGGGAARGARAFTARGGRSLALTADIHRACSDIAHHDDEQ